MHNQTEDVMHMDHHFTFPHELSKLNKKLLHLSAIVEEKIRLATKLIENHNRKMAQSLINSDYEVDELEVEIEEDCLKILALHQPVASDLRFIITVIKINNEMERIADMAVNIAMRVDNISKFNHDAATSYEFGPMSDKVISMLKKSIDSLVNRDAVMAKTIFLDDDFVDSYRNRCYEDIKVRIKEDPEHPGYHINTYLLARHLERIGDRTVNIAEEVIYLVEGTITRFN